MGKQTSHKQLKVYLTNCNQTQRCLTSTTKSTLINNINRYQFHYIDENNYTFLCMADSAYSKRMAFSFLEDIQQRFMDDISSQKRDEAFQYSLNKVFVNTLKSRVQFYNSGEADRLGVLKNNLNQNIDLMIENIDKILDREEKIDLLVTKAQKMNYQSSNLKKQATQVKRKAYWKNMKIKIILAIIFIVFYYLYILAHYLLYHCICMWRIHIQ